MLTILSDTLYYLLENVRIFCSAKDSHIFSTKKQKILTFFQQKKIMYLQYLLNS